jgi:hypothetical protein
LTPSRRWRTSTFETAAVIAAIAGGVVTAIGWVLFAALDPTYSKRSGRHWLPVNLMIMLGGAAMAVGVVALLAVQDDQTVVKVVGASLLVFGLVASHVVVQGVQTFRGPVPLWMPIVALAALIPGSVLFLVSTALDDVFRGPVTWGVVAAALLGPVLANVVPPRPGNVLEVPFPLAIAWLGSVAYLA